MKQSLRIREVAEVLNCSVRTAYRLVEMGDLPAFRVRTSLRVPAEALESYRQQQISRYEDEVMGLEQ